MSDPAARSRASHTSPRFIPPPATAAHRACASRRGAAIPARARRSVAASTASPTEDGAAARSGTQALPFPREPEGGDQVVQVTVQQLRQVVDRVVDAVIRDAVHNLSELLDGNLDDLITGADLGAPVAGAGGFLLSEPLVEQA